MLGPPTMRTDVTIRRVSYMVSPSSSVFIGLDIAGLWNYNYTMIYFRFTPRFIS